MKKYVNIAYVSVITLILFFFSTENLFAQDGWGTSVEADISKKIIKNLEA